MMGANRCCLTVGGSDTCGGAGIQADLRVFDRMGVRGCSAITALTAQNPARITRVEPVPLAQFDAELHAISDHYAISAIKTGMLTSAGHIGVLLAWRATQAPDAALVVDPVMRASSGRALLDKAGASALTAALAPQASLLTPNRCEAELWLGRPVRDAEADACALASRVGVPVLLKGGHAPEAASGNTLRDLLAWPDGAVRVFTHPRKCANAEQQHGTGCRLAAALAARLARGDSLEDAAARAIAFLQADL